MNQGTSIDAELNFVPSSTENKTGVGTQRRTRPTNVTTGTLECSRGPAKRLWSNRFAEANSSGVDKESDLIHSVETTTTIVHDIKRAVQLLPVDEQVTYGVTSFKGTKKR